MIKIKWIYTRTIVCSLLITFCLCQNSTQSKSVDNGQRSKVNVGREDPFSKLPMKKKILPVSRGVSEITSFEEYRPELYIEVVTLKFLDAKSLMTVVEGLSSEFGRISSDAKNNALIICDTRENLEMILTEISKADKTPQQIMIEVVILDVQLNDDTDIGINWDILADKRDRINYRQNFTTSRLDSKPDGSGTTSFNSTGLGGDLSIISSSIFSSDIRNVIHFIQQKRNVEILASPRVMTVSGQTASIEAVEELPYTEVTGTSTGGAEALTSTQFKIVGVKLEVTAILIDDNSIFLTVDAEQNVKTGESNSEVPIVDTRKAHTSLLLKDGQVVIMGGLRRQEKTEEIDQIPILGDLPIIGALFKSTNTIVKNSELIVFLSPHIYKNEPIGKEEMAKFKELKDKPMLSLPKDKDAKE